jgi:hypothetical protein
VVNANQVFNWLKNPCFAARPENNDAARFLPVEIIDAVQPEERAIAIGRKTGSSQVQSAVGDQRRSPTP